MLKVVEVVEEDERRKSKEIGRRLTAEVERGRRSEVGEDRPQSSVVSVSQPLP